MSRKRNRRSRRLTERAWWLMEQDDLEGGDDGLDLDDELDLEDEEGDDEMVPKSDVVDAVAAVLDVDPVELQDLVAASEGEEGEEGEVPQVLDSSTAQPLLEALSWLHQQS